MSFFKKEVPNLEKEERRGFGLPELPNSFNLPELPELPRMPEQGSNESEDLKPLPSFPRTSLGESLNLQTIKDNVSSSNIQGNKEKRTFELSDDSGPKNIKKDPVYVKLDKFQEALTKFDEIKSKISNIEVLLRRIKELKEKEENELKEWAEEVSNIKQKASAIDVSLFNKV